MSLIAIDDTQLETILRRAYRDGRNDSIKDSEKRLKAKTVTVKEACEMLRVGVTTVYKMIKDGDLVTKKIFGKTLITIASIENHQ